MVRLGAAENDTDESRERSRLGGKEEACTEAREGPRGGEMRLRKGLHTEGHGSSGYLSLSTVLWFRSSRAFF